MASASRGAAGRSVKGPLAGLVAVDELFMASVAWRLWPAVSLNRTWKQTCLGPQSRARRFFVIIGDRSAADIRLCCMGILEAVGACPSVEG